MSHTTNPAPADAGEDQSDPQVSLLPEIVSRSWTCDCGATVTHYRSEGDVTCTHCDQEYNAFGQRLRSRWRENISNYDDEVSDLDGYELAYAEPW